MYITKNKEIRRYSYLCFIIALVMIFISVFMFSTNGFDNYVEGRTLNPNLIDESIGWTAGTIFYLLPIFAITFIGIGFWGFIVKDTKVHTKGGKKQK